MIVHADGRRVPRAAFDRKCQAVAQELRRRGITADDRVLLTGANSEDFIVVLFALMECGVSIALVDSRLSAAEQGLRAAESGARRILTDEPGDDDAPGPQRLLLSEIAAAAAAGERAEPVSHARWFARDDALIVWSSGSTGAPKGIVRSGGSLSSNIARTAARMAYRHDDVLLPMLPFTHQYGLSMLLLWQLTGATLVLESSSRRIDVALDVIHDHGVTVVDAVPATYHSLLNVMERSRRPMSRLASVRMWCVGGEPLRRELDERFRRVVGMPLLDGYGSSEAGNIALAVPPAPVGCGQPLDGITVRIVDEAGRTLPPGEIGEIIVRTPDYMTGLLEPGGAVRPVADAEYRTNDIGRVDAEGNLTVLGRRKAVHRFGHTLYPDAIADRAAACGAPVRVIPVESDRDNRAHLVFFVSDDEQRSSAFWRQEIQKCVVEHEWPNRVVVLSEFPLNGTGKVDGQALMRQAESAVHRETENKVVR